MIKKTLPDLWHEYDKATNYNNKIGLYETVKQNENFFIGKQWEGVKADGLDKPVINIIKRVVSYFISMIVSDDIGASFTAYDQDHDLASKVLKDEIERIIEDTKFKSKCRDMLRNSAVDGDNYFYIPFDPDEETGQDAKGKIKVDLVDNSYVLFGNPYNDDLQGQPYLLIAARRTVDSVKEEAKRNGIPDAEIESILPDEDAAYSDDDDLVTVVVKLWKENKQVKAMKYTKDVVIRPEWETGLSLYPVAGMSWEKVKNSYHGQSPVTALIPNQIFINKLFAMAMQSVKLMAFPKIFYNKDRVSGWSNSLDNAIGVDGDPSERVFSAFKAPDMSAQVMNIIDKMVEYTKDTMGASDAALGNVNPDNTSAIIAVQKASSAPLELQRLAFYQFVEDCIRIMLDTISANYGMRYVPMEDADGITTMQVFDFGTIPYANLQLKVDVGAAAYWSELTQIQTLDNLFTKGIITDAITYLEGVPDAYIKGKNDIIAKLKAQQEAAQQQQGLQNDVLASLSPEERAAVDKNPELLQQVTQ